MFFLPKVTKNKLAHSEASECDSPECLVIEFKTVVYQDLKKNLPNKQHKRRKKCHKDSCSTEVIGLVLNIYLISLLGIR